VGGGLVLHGEVSFSGFPFVADFAQESGNQAFQGFFIGEECGHTGAAFDLLVEPFQAVGGAQFFAMRFRQVKNR
jgi:hypothetical protein